MLFTPAPCSSFPSRWPSLVLHWVLLNSAHLISLQFVPCPSPKNTLLHGNSPITSAHIPALPSPAQHRIVPLPCCFSKGHLRGGWSWWGSPLANLSFPSLPPSLVCSPSLISLLRMPVLFSASPSPLGALESPRLFQAGDKGSEAAAFPGRLDADAVARHARHAWGWELGRAGGGEPAPRWLL